MGTPFCNGGSHSLQRECTCNINEPQLSLGCEQPPGLDDDQSLHAQDAFQPIPGLISCTGVTGSVGTTCHAHAIQMTSLRSPHMLVTLVFYISGITTQICMYCRHVHDKSKQGKYIHPEQLSLFSKKKLPWVGFEPTTLRILGERSTS